MYWEKKDNSDSSFSTLGINTWLPEAEKPVETTLKDTVTDMVKLRMKTTPIYVKAIFKENQIMVNCDVR